MNKFFHIIAAFLLIAINLKAQVIIDTESSLKKIDSTFHIFASFMSDKKQGNFEFGIKRADVTLGSLMDKNLFRLTYSHSSTKFNGNLFNQSNHIQFRWNYLLNEKNSLFLFAQTGNNLRSFIDERTLFGIGLRKHLFLKDKNYFDIAVGPFIENEFYSSYTFQDVEYNSSENRFVRFSFNIFGSVKIMKNISALTTLYTQWKYNEIRNYRIFGNQYIRFKINDKVSTYLRYIIHYRSIKYVLPLKNDTDFMYGIEINI